MRTSRIFTGQALTVAVPAEPTSVAVRLVPDLSATGVIGDLMAALRRLELIQDDGQQLLADLLSLTHHCVCIRSVVETEKSEKTRPPHKMSHGECREVCSASFLIGIYAQPGHHGGRPSGVPLAEHHNDPSRERPVSQVIVDDFDVRNQLGVAPGVAHSQSPGREWRERRPLDNLPGSDVRMVRLPSAVGVAKPADHNFRPRWDPHRLLVTGASQARQPHAPNRTGVSRRPGRGSSDPARSVEPPDIGASPRSTSAQPPRSCPTRNDRVSGNSVRFGIGASRVLVRLWAGQGSSAQGPLGKPCSVARVRVHTSS